MCLIGSGQIDQISRNGLLTAENAGLRIAHEIRVAGLVEKKSSAESF
jgi:hypothetical protein